MKGGTHFRQDVTMNQTGLRLANLPQLPGCWDFRYISLGLANQWPFK